MRKLLLVLGLLLASHAARAVDNWPITFYNPNEALQKYGGIDSRFVYTSDAVLSVPTIRASNVTGTFNPGGLTSQYVLGDGSLANFPVTIARGGTGSNISAPTTGTILQSNGSVFIKSTPTWPTAVSTNGKVVMSNGTNFLMSTCIFPGATPANKIIYSSAADDLGGGLGGTSQIVGFDSGSVPVAISVIPVANGGTGQATNSTIFADFADHGNTDGGEDILVANSIAADTLGANGKSLEFRLFGIYGAGGDDKTIRVYFGPLGTASDTKVFDSDAQTLASTSWSVTGSIVDSGTNTQRCIVSFGGGIATPVGGDQYTATAVTESAVQFITITGEAASTNQIVSKASKGWTIAAP